MRFVFVTIQYSNKKENSIHNTIANFLLKISNQNNHATCEKQSRCRALRSRVTSALTSALGQSRLSRPGLGPVAAPALSLSVTVTVIGLARCRCHGASGSPSRLTRPASVEYSGRRDHDCSFTLRSLSGAQTAGLRLSARRGALAQVSRGSRRVLEFTLVSPCVSADASSLSPPSPARVPFSALGLARPARPPPGRSRSALSRSLVLFSGCGVWCCENFTINSTLKYLRR